MTTVAEVRRTWTVANGDYLRLVDRWARLRMARRAAWIRHRMAALQLPGDPRVISDAEVDTILGYSADAEQHFLAGDPSLEAIEAALADCESARLEGLLEMERRLPGLERVTRAFGLDRFERETLALCYAVEAEPELLRVCAYLHDDAGRAVLTPDLAVRLLVDDPVHRHLAATRFGPAGRLVHGGLLRLEGTASEGTALATRAIRLEPRILGAIRGVDAVDPDVARCLVRSTIVARTRRERELSHRLAALLREEDGARPPLVQLISAPDQGAEAIATGAAHALGAGLWWLEGNRIATTPPGVREQLLRRLSCEARLAGAMVYLDVSPPGTDAVRSDAVEEIAAVFDGVILLAAQEELRLSRESRALRLPPLDLVQRVEHWRLALGEAASGLDGALDQVVQQFPFGPATIARTVRTLAAEPAREGEETESALWRACRHQATQVAGENAQRIEARATWADIVLPTDSMEQLRELAAQVRGRPKVYETWGFGPRLSRGRGITALFAGPSGTGKTLAAEVLAAELGLDLFRVDLAGVVDKYIGETEKRIRDVFDSCERSGGILFCDEADALFGRRTEVRDSHDRYANIEVDYLLQRMEAYEGLAILATNRRSAIDRAFLRRLRFVIDFPFPDAEYRRRIWQISFPPASERAELDLAHLARLELSGGNIRTIAINAAFLAAAEGAAIGMAHVLRAARREYAKLEKPFGPAEIGRYGTGKAARHA